MAVIVALPVAVVYIALQKQITGGLTTGAVKG
jgi:ABC-type maltose transport system permease subunit